MVDPTLEVYWNGIHAELRGIFGPAGGDVVVTPALSRMAASLAVTTARAALEIGAGNGFGRSTTAEAAPQR